MAAGLDLKLRRVAARVKARDLAREMGFTPSRLSVVESLERVTPEMEWRYLFALETLTDVPDVKIVSG